MAKNKQYNDNAKKYDRDALHSDAEAIAIIKSLGTKKFDETVDIVIRLGVDPRKAEQMVRGTVSLPSGTGKDVRIAVFAQGEAANAAREAGAEFVGDDDLAAEVEKGMTNFDIAIATPDMMPTVGKLGRVLGPRGLMPNPKTGTVTSDVVKAINEFKGGMVEYRTDRFANVHVPIGKASFDEAALLLNLRALIGELEKVKPASSKGKYVKKVVVSTTMGPGVRIDPANVTTDIT
ncbi:MAG: 50S ribosomal protein L1 [Actinobacteria bacterium]|jgi:large subunit ribosomal protein L1|nr:50S ribosomal protein L1 [Actinomycetota bacterium]NCG37973.1 50S ribosomal protein L1 [Actinomycetota bacterium]